MNKLNVAAKSRELAKQAATASSGRASQTVFGGHEKQLRQTVIAMREGTTLAEHANPGEATLLVISGRLWLTSGEDRWSGREMDYLVVPDARHGIEAETDTTFVLTVMMPPR
ncbi:cupin domain-containing protein [Tessaracoccus antarcticus]|uniref:LuxR family transcriptional regulator n=1 Tax=Tessaracoccus antarcticus TaxID=2479848 RepID=A0A3M0G9Y4_9ACTN|nr:LuxR family transcriptional regulator [Tessaracoccus antarcticus]RMB61805.1 LuxR family transcriptional regulator [Tessaracoccus antarcticus]